MRAALMFAACALAVPVLLCAALYVATWVAGTPWSGMRD